MKNNKICVYTCITGNYDNLNEIEFTEDIFDYYCFTNNKKIKSKTWKVIYIEDSEISNIMLARKTKILGNKYVDKYDVTIWIDGDMKIDRPLSEFLENEIDLSNYDLVSFKHHVRNNIKDEMKANLYFNRENREKLARLDEFYKKEKFKDDQGLIESTIIVRKNIKVVKDTMKLWFDMLKEYTHRDQLSFNYVVTKTNLKYNLISLNVWNNNYFRFISHNKVLTNDVVHVYFKNNKGTENEINKYVNDKFEGVLHSKFTENKNILEYEFDVPYNTNEIKIESIYIPYTVIKNIRFSKDYKYEIKNFLKYDSYYVMNYNNGIINLIGNYKKNEHIKVSITLENNDKIISLINIIVDKDREIYNKNKELENLYINYNFVLNNRIKTRIKRKLSNILTKMLFWRNYEKK